MNNFTPKGFRVLFKIEQKKSMLEVEKNYAESKGTLVSHGEDCWKDKSCNWAKPGDTIYVKKYAGKVFDFNDEIYRILKDEDIFMVKDDSKVGWKPAGDRVVVKPEKDEVQKKAESAGIHLPDSYQESQAMNSTKAKVVSIGEDCWEGTEPYADIGDDVIIGKVTGEEFTGDDGEIYRLINDLDILGVLTTD